MNEYILNNKKYVIEKDLDNIFDYDIVKELVTSYFDSFDYILGDIAYNKLRLKGFCNKNNKNYNKINDIDALDDYIKNYCAYGCKYFILKKMQ